MLLDCEKNLGVFSAELMCHWISWTAVTDSILRLDLPKLNCCDMEGAIKVARAICPRVCRIYVYSDGEIDATYIKKNGKWMYCTTDYIVLYDIFRAKVADAGAV